MEMRVQFELINEGITIWNVEYQINNSSHL